MSNPIRIGTRASKLALWQANKVKNILEAEGFSCVLIPIQSQGDKNLTQPLYEMGITGVFTKALDLALLNNRIDLAVHSYKDVPTKLPKTLKQLAVLQRGFTTDVLVTKKPIDLSKPLTIATGSLRRKAQWLHRFPNHKIVGLRGNVNSRLEKLESHAWDGAIFAKAGLERLQITPAHFKELHDFLPAPAQGAVMVMTQESNTKTRALTDVLNCNQTAICTNAERVFLRTLEGGCSAPIAALATLEDNALTFNGALYALDGSKKISVGQTFKMAAPMQKDKITQFAEQCASYILNNGGNALLNTIKAQL